MVSATIGNAQVGKSITDGMLTLDREKLEAMPVANYGEHVALFIETNLVKYSTEIELYTLVVKNKQDYMSIGSLSRRRARITTSCLAVTLCSLTILPSTAVCLSLSIVPKLISTATAVKDFAVS